ncbi:MAG: PAS domain S-box protein [Nitrospiraceae bacterium]|nr:PAS domain S-box protein [Nitrospiraceae bacterium]
MRDGKKKQHMAQLTAGHITEAHYKKMIQTSMDGFLVYDIHGRILDANDAYCKLIGCHREELLNNHVTDFEQFEKPEEIAKHFEKIMQPGSDRFVTRQKCKDGKVVDVEISVNYSKSNGGRYFAFLRDITDRIRLENELHSKEETYRIFVENSPT